MTFVLLILALVAVFCTVSAAGVLHQKVYQGGCLCGCLSALGFLFIDYAAFDVARVALDFAIIGTYLWFGYENHKQGR